MFAVLLLVHLLISASLVGVVLLQRSEGGALGGLGGGGNSFMTGRGAANALTRTTAILFAAFLTTSILLTILGNARAKQTSILDRAPDSHTSAPVQPVLPLPSTPLGAPAPLPK
jgi:preprotein translocase subunit SecG